MLNQQLCVQTVGTKILILVSHKSLNARPELWRINLYDASPEFVHQRSKHLCTHVLVDADLS